jgi:hypothetical protein
VGNRPTPKSTAGVEILITTDKHPTTKVHGEPLMQALMRRMGPCYTNSRNYDTRRVVSCLSFCLRHRLVLEHDLVANPLSQQFLRSANATLHIGGDQCLGARIEAAWASGDAIPNDIFRR